MAYSYIYHTPNTPRSVEGNVIKLTTTESNSTGSKKINKTIASSIAINNIKTATGIGKKFSDAAVNSDKCSTTTSRKSEIENEVPVNVPCGAGLGAVLFLKGRNDIIPPPSTIRPGTGSLNIRGPKYIPTRTVSFAPKVNNNAEQYVLNNNNNAFNFSVFKDF